MMSSTIGGNRQTQTEIPNSLQNREKTRSAAKLPSKAERIFNEFIGTEAPREVRFYL